MTPAASRLEQVLGTAPPRLVDIDRDDAGRLPASGGWSKKQILGHLIDSAGNNHQRFVRAQFVPHLEFPNYRQEAWVAAQSYATEPWPDLVNLWLLLNRHLLHIVRNTPAERLSHTCSIGGKDPMALADLMEDYVRHMEHHLEQIFATAPPGTEPAGSEPGPEGAPSGSGPGSR
ncbi:MAG: DinB family protein [Bryobacteraceae bacterium]